MMTIIHVHDDHHPYILSPTLLKHRITGMARSQAEKAQTRERILTEAAAQIRDTGLESVSIASLMHSVDLTHGGFYNHFESRADLLVQALERALEEGAARSRQFRDPSRPPGRPVGFESFVKHYLSRSHRDARAQGCALAALASDVARADAPVRAVMEQRFEAFVGAVAQAMQQDDHGHGPGETRAKASSKVGAETSAKTSAEDAALSDRATTAACTLIGALLMSRVMTDTKQSDALLRTVHEQISGP
jgi:TetR/AcrR family transcriptional repressor of nem operon